MFKNINFILALIVGLIIFYKAGWWLNKNAMNKDKAIAISLLNIYLRSLVNQNRIHNDLS